MKFCPECKSKLEVSIIDERERLGCPSPNCEFVLWENPVPVVAAIVEYRDKIVMARNSLWPEGIFALITGFLEKGETPESAVIREVKEEIGLEAEIESFVGNYSFFQKNQLLIIFHVKCTGEIKLNHEIAEVKLLDFHNVSPWSFGTGPALKEWLKSKGIEKEFDNSPFENMRK